MRVLRKVHLPLALLALITIMASINANTQDPAGLDRRISMLEQRFYTLQASISRLEQVVVNQRTPVPSGRDPQVEILRQEVEGMKLRLNEIECGLVKLDERTTTASAATRKRDGDPCRLNPDSPVRLSTRP